MGNFDLNLFLEILNGSWSLLTFYFLIFLTYYLYRSSLRLTWQDWLLALPLGMAVALSLYLVNLGTFISRFTIWLWRYTTDGRVPLSYFEIGILCLGSFLGTWGLFCMIRVYTKPFFGEWPWIFSAVSLFAYIGWALINRG